MIRSTQTINATANAAPATTPFPTSNASNAQRIRSAIIPAVRLPDPAPASRHAVMQAGLQRFVQHSRNESIAQRAIAPIGRSRHAPRETVAATSPTTIPLRARPTTSVASAAAATAIPAAFAVPSIRRGNAVRDPPAAAAAAPATIPTPSPAAIPAAFAVPTSILRRNAVRSPPATIPTPASPAIATPPRAAAPTPVGGRTGVRASRHAPGAAAAAAPTPPAGAGVGEEEGDDKDVEMEVDWEFGDLLSIEVDW